MITKATGKRPYFVGKPNPVMIREGMNKIGAHSETSALVGDRMDTDVVSAIEAGLHSCLVLTGSSSLEDIEMYPYRPAQIYESIGDLVSLVK